MLANFFSIGDRNYLNNAVVIADALDTIGRIFGNVNNFKIQFRKPFLSQGEFRLGVDKLEGNITGQFEFNGTNFYFSYTDTDIELENKTASRNDIEKEITPFTICYYITDVCRGVIESGFEKVYGPMAQDDKVIFVIFEIPDTSVFNLIISNKIVPTIGISEAEYLGNRRFKLAVNVNGLLLGYRYSTVKRFNI